MVKFIRQGVYFTEEGLVKQSQAFMTSDKKARAVQNTMTHALLSGYVHGEQLALPVGRVAMGGEEAKNVFLTAEALGLAQSFLPCAVVASAWDDFDFLLSAAKKWGVTLLADGAGEAYVREQFVSPREIVLGTQYFPCGALGALHIVDDEGAVLRALLGAPYLSAAPQTVGVCLKGKLRKGVGPTDVALAIIRALKGPDSLGGKLLEVFGPGLAGLSMESRSLIDGWLRRTGCFATLWTADERTKEYMEEHGRGEHFQPLSPKNPAYYDLGISVDLSRIEPMLAVWPAVFSVREAAEDPAACGLCAEGETPLFTNLFIGGMSGTYENLAEAAEIVRGKQLPAGIVFSASALSPSVEKALIENGYAAALLTAGVRAGGGNARAGLTASDGRIVAGGVILDARTLAHTAACGGTLCSALGLSYNRRLKKYAFDGAVYASRAFAGTPDLAAPLDHAHGTSPLPAMGPLPEALDLKIAAAFEDPLCGDGEECGALLPVKAEGETEEEGTMSAFGVLYTDHAEGAEWGQAIWLRANGYRAVLAKEFSEKLLIHLADWGILPLRLERVDLHAGDRLVLSDLRAAVAGGGGRIAAKVFSAGRPREIFLTLPALPEAERGYLLCGSRVTALRSAQK